MPIPESFLHRLRSARRLTILTGAGVSAASGVPTFRGAGGLWRQFRPEELATADAFRRDPALVWTWYAWRQETIAACAPNAAHHAIAKWSQRDGCRVLTQNVDDLHLEAGTRRLVRLHGSIWEQACWSACGQPPWRNARVTWPREGDAIGAIRLDAGTARLTPDGLPACPSCGGLARPAVVWFGESLEAAVVDAALAACDCDVFVAVGTSALVYPAAGLVEEASRRGAFTAEINPDATPASTVVDLSLRGAAEAILPRLLP